jgi:hypothetical protein
MSAQEFPHTKALNAKRLSEITERNVVSSNEFALANYRRKFRRVGSEMLSVQQAQSRLSMRRYERVEPLKDPNSTISKAKVTFNFEPDGQGILDGPMRLRFKVTPVGGAANCPVLQFPIKQVLVYINNGNTLVDTITSEQLLTAPLRHNKDPKSLSRDLRGNGVKTNALSAAIQDQTWNPEFGSMYGGYTALTQYNTIFTQDSAETSHERFTEFEYNIRLWDLVFRGDGVVPGGLPQQKITIVFEMRNFLPTGDVSNSAYLVDWTYVASSMYLEYDMEVSGQDQLNALTNLYKTEDFHVAKSKFRVVHQEVASLTDNTAVTVDLKDHEGLTTMIWVLVRAGTLTDIEENFGDFGAATTTGPLAYGSISATVGGRKALALVDCGRETTISLMNAAKVEQLGQVPMTAEQIWNRFHEAYEGNYCPFPDYSESTTRGVDIRRHLNGQFPIVFGGSIDNVFNNSLLVGSIPLEGVEKLILTPKGMPGGSFGTPVVISVILIQPGYIPLKDGRLQPEKLFGEEHPR